MSLGGVSFQTLKNMSGEVIQREIVTLKKLDARSETKCATNIRGTELLPRLEGYFRRCSG